MAEEQKTETETGTGALTVGELRKFITDTVQSVVGTIGKTEEKTHEAAQDHTQETLARKGNIASEVQAELEKLRRREERASRDKTIDEKLAALEKVTEQHPVERRRVHKLMGWGE